MALAEIEWGQPSEGNLKPCMPQETFTRNFLSPWADSLPNPKKILDLACGQGIEMDFISKRGYEIFGVDMAETMNRNKYNQNIVQGCLTALPFSDNTFSGALLKDVLLFLSPEQRSGLLDETSRILKPGGSLLILAEDTSKLRVRYMPYDSIITQHETFDDNSNWQDKVLEVEKWGEVYYVEFRSCFDDLKSIADKKGLNAELIENYRYNHPLALETRWGQPRDGFIAKISK